MGMSPATTNKMFCAQVKKPAPVRAPGKSSNPLKINSIVNLRRPGAQIQLKTVCPCDGGCPRCVPVQAKLKIGQPNDRYEQEADRMADQVMRMPEPGMSNVKCDISNSTGDRNILHRQPEESCPECEEDDENIRTKPIGDQIAPLIQRETEEEDDLPEDEYVPEKEVDDDGALRAKLNEKIYLQPQEVSQEEEADEGEEPLLFKRNS